MSKAGVDGLSSALLTIASDGEQIALIHRLLDRYCHRFRNRLNSMKLSLYLGRRGVDVPLRGPWSELERRYLTLERFLDQLQLFCRPFELNPIETTLDLFLEERWRAWSPRLSEHDQHLELIPPDRPARGRFDPSRLGQGLDALAFWRLAILPSGSAIQIRWWEREGWLHLRWQESTPPVLSARIGPGDPPANIALPILARIVRAHGGTLEVALQDRLGLTLRWPRLPRTP